MNLPSGTLKNRAALIKTITGLAAFVLTFSSTARADTDGGEQELLRGLATMHHVCAVSMAVIRNRQLKSVYVASGCDPALALDAHSVFEAASLGKPVFAYAVLKLAAQEKIGLDTTLLTYLPQGYVHRQNPFDDRGGGKN